MLKVFDPDFHIYNDVTIDHPDGKLDIFGYPETAFPPTDFHTATLIDDRILIIGNLGCSKNREDGITQIAELDLKTFAIRLIPSTGAPPGWIHKHIAELAPDRKSILVRGGIIDSANEDSRSLLENPDEWSLDLVTWTWARMTQHPWERHVFSAEGVRHLPLWQIRSLSSSIKYDWDSKLNPEIHTHQKIVSAEKWEEFQHRFGKTNPSAQADAAGLYAKGYNPDLEVFGKLYEPAVPHTAIPEMESPDEETEEEYDENGPHNWDEEDYSTPGDVFDGTRISVQGVTVRYKSNTGQVILTIEGKLPPATVRILIDDLRGKLEILLNRPVITRQS